MAPLKKKGQLTNTLRLSKPQAFQISDECANYTISKHKTVSKAWFSYSSRVPSLGKN